MRMTNFSCWIFHSDVLKLGNVTRINERCLELQKSSKNLVSKIKVLDIFVNLNSKFDVYIDFRMSCKLF